MAKMHADVRYRPLGGEDSPTADAAETGAYFDKVIELQASSNGAAGARHAARTPRWQERRGGAAEHWLLPLWHSIARRLFTPRVRGLVLLNLVRRGRLAGGGRGAGAACSLAPLRPPAAIPPARPP